MRPIFFAACELKSAPCVLSFLFSSRADPGIGSGVFPAHAATLSKEPASKRISTACKSQTIAPGSSVTTARSCTPPTAAKPGRFNQARREALYSPYVSSPVQRLDQRQLRHAFANQRRRQELARGRRTSRSIFSLRIGSTRPWLDGRQPRHDDREPTTADAPGPTCRARRPDF